MKIESDKNNIIKEIDKAQPNPWGLVPLYFFFALFLITLIKTGNVGNLPIVVAFLLTSILAIAICKGNNLMQKVNTYCKGFTNDTLTLMLLIFILAGAFAAIAKSMGAVDASVNIILTLLPAKYLYLTLFVSACFISMAMGTSVGTIVALTPIAAGLSLQLGLSAPFVVAIIIGGAMFGDNLSFISDTNIAATQTQKCGMKDKFYNNVKIVLPAFLLIAVIYLIKGNSIDLTNSIELEDTNWLKIIPYLVVLVLAMSGLNVIVVLVIGIFGAIAIGFFTKSITVSQSFDSIQQGIVGDMGELIIVTLMAGGVFSVIAYNGGIAWLQHQVSRKIKNSRGAEFAIAFLLLVTNMATANNTIAILIVGPIAKDISDKYALNKKRVASILDTISCFAQGLLPYGAQVLIAAKIASQIVGEVAPTQIIPFLYYPMMIGVCTIISIIIRYPK